MNIADDADRLQTLLYSAYDSDTVRDMERPLLDDGVPLMRMAASAAAHVTMTLLDDEDLTIEARSCTPEAAFSHSTPPPKSPDVPWASPQERPENGCRPQ